MLPFDQEPTAFRITTRPSLAWRVRGDYCLAWCGVPWMAGGVIPFGDLGASEVDVPPLHVGADEFGVKSVSNIETLLALGEESFDVRLQNANERSTIGHAGDDG